MKKICGFFFILFWWVHGLAADPAIPGRVADFRLKDLEGVECLFSQYRGKVVLIDFWAVWCIGCRKTFPWLNGLREAYDTAQVVIVGINLDEKKPEEIKKFIGNAGIRYAILCDPEGKTARQFKISGLPTILLVGADGKPILLKRGWEEKEKETVRKALDSELQRCFGKVPKGNSTVRGN